MTLLDRLRSVKGIRTRPEYAQWLFVFLIVCLFVNLVLASINGLIWFAVVDIILLFMCALVAWVAHGEVVKRR